MHGRGVLQYANGDRYEGEFCRDLFFGRGRFQYADGGYFEGEYVKTKGGYEHGVRFPDPDGRRNGHGVRVWVTGRCTTTYLLPSHPIFLHRSQSYVVAPSPLTPRIGK